jgi:serine/threonine-protein kinase ULK/ATG1
VRTNSNPDTSILDKNKDRSAPKQLSTEGSIIPGESEEDGIIRKEYVLVGDLRALEFNRAVDGTLDCNQSFPHTDPSLYHHTELNTARRGPLRERRTAGSPLADEAYPPDRASPSSNSVSPPSAPIPTTYNTTFPPPPHPLAPPLSSSPTRVASNALSRALSLASRKLFGVSTPKSPVSPGSGHYHAPSSPRRPQILLRAPTDEGDMEKNGVLLTRDPMEDELLTALEELAQKTDVLTHWADEMYEAVKAVPQSQLFLFFGSFRKIMTDQCA